MADPGETLALVLGDTLVDFDAVGVVDVVLVTEGVALGARKRRMTAPWLFWYPKPVPAAEVVAGEKMECVLLTKKPPPAPPPPEQPFFPMM